MAVVGELIVLISGNHLPLIGSLAKSEAAIKGFGLTAGAALVGLGVAAAVIGVKAIESASKFEDAMTLIETQAGGSRQEVEAMTTAILKLAPSVATGPMELADALYHIESTGHRGADALDLLTTSAKLAKIGQADLEATTDTLLAAMNSGVGGFTSSAQAAGILNSIIGSGNMRMEDLNAAIGTGFLSRAATFGISLQSIGAALATMTASGQPAEISATRLGMTLSLLGAPTGKAVKLLSTIGLGQYDLANAMRGPDGVLGAVAMLNEHLGGLGKTEKAAFLSRAFGGGRSSGAIMSLIEMLETLPIIQQSVIDGASDLEESWRRQSALASTQWERVGISIDVVVKAIGLALIPAVDQLLTAVVPVFIAFAQWTTDNPALAANILLVAGAVGAVAAASFLLMPVLGLIGALASPLGLVFIAIGAAVALVATHMDELQRGIAIVTPYIAPLANAIGTVLGTVINAVAASVAALIKGLQDAIAFAQALAGWVVGAPATGTPVGAGPTLGSFAGTGAPLGSSAGPGALGNPRGSGLGGALVGPRGPSAPIQVNRTTNLIVDGRKLAEMTERELYNDASVYSSGFSSGSSTIR